MSNTIWDRARTLAGQRNTTVDAELSRLAKKGAQKRAAKKRRQAWMSNPENGRLPYAD
jgi:predicted transcriptional regulator